MLTHTNQLNNAQLRDLNHLLAQCRLKDGSTPNVYPHILIQQRPFFVNGLYYQDAELIGFISVFFFYEDCCEVSLLVDPAQRRKGLGRQLLQSVLPILQAQPIKTLIFSSPHQTNEEWLMARGFEYQLSEYHMERRSLQPVLVPQRLLSFKNASPQDISALCLVDKACFPKDPAKMLARFHSLFNDRDYQLILAYLDNEPIGKAHIRWQAKGATFSDIGILPPLQGQGFGTGLIAHCINLALAEGKPNLDLDVEIKNTKALKLYTRLGFKTQNACDYWQLPLSRAMSL
ncbi:GNAT family N-acetyltransferase [Legionella israelensis]|uniref:N-acetyltransferase domain-containing protein n=1 Tax=Legionella israelensis TaxID=454 RepID=A0A0W0VQY1_9GAMM|nr:GNAT family N-acetyltransferase [Legionella israelensis]KTD22483.1 hypothetical protein Lisr_1504 [Legionella israelensis]QBS09556.1 GNAT family N-acetyltransferase [Legionella israelensis]SCY17236.1 Ribosomal protein S18 acetylase RimI [Legionella israelensis DSM 19235]STX60476.1 N-terminal GNAT family acetyltransferase [Legionella israelensis]